MTKAERDALITIGIIGQLDEGQQEQLALELRSYVSMCLKLERELHKAIKALDKLEKEVHNPIRHKEV